MAWAVSRQVNGIWPYCDVNGEWTRPRYQRLSVILFLILVGGIEVSLLRRTVAVHVRWEYLYDFRR